MKRIIKKINQSFGPIYYKFIAMIYADKKVFLYWFSMGQNFGDSINPLFISMLSGKKIVKVIPNLVTTPYVTAIGSIIEHTTKDAMIWGSGFISEDSKLEDIPLKVLAVRGPKSRSKMLEHGIECPEVYGDPALLLPRLYSPKIEKKFSLGIIPHVFDKNNVWIEKVSMEHSNIKIIDLAKENVWEIIDDILSCERIASSSLHGIIVADAYEVPSVWVEFSDKVIGKGFKFLDYFESVGRKDKEALQVTMNTTIQEIEECFYDYTLNIDLDSLIKAAPFQIQKQYL